MPHPETLDVSVIRHLNTPDDDLWLIGEQIVGATVERKLKGRADLAAVEARNQSLTVDPSPPPVNHAVIVGWPREKDKQKLIASELAAKATFFPRP